MAHAMDVKPAVAVTLAVIAGWYFVNIGVLLLNKYILSSTGFKQPIFLTLCHMVACATLGATLSALNITPIKPLRSAGQAARVALLSVIFCITIVFANMSLNYIPVSFNQAIGATTPFFTAIFAFSMQGVRESSVTYLALLPIAIGCWINSGGEPLFHAYGFTLCLIATAGRALKSVVQSMLLSDPAERLDPMSLLLYMSLTSVLLLLPATWAMEPQAFAQASLMMELDPSFVWSLLANSFMAYAVNLLNFLVTKYTSALTLQVLGNAKGVIGAAVSIAVFHNPVTLKGCVGYAITVLGVFLYSESKRKKWGVKAQSSVLLKHAADSNTGLTEGLLRGQALTNRS